MARMRSIIASVIRGSVGGLTYTANQWHQIIVRSRTAPVQPNTGYQTMLRSAFTSAASLWTNYLTEEQRLGWHNYAQTCPYEGPLGVYYIPGRQMFIACRGTRTYLYDRGLPFAVSAFEPPTTPGWLSIGIGEPTAPTVPGTGFSIPISNWNTDIVFAYAYRSIGFQESRNRYKGPWITQTLRYAEITYPTPGIIEYLGLHEGSVYFAHIRAIAKSDPIRISQDFYVRAVASTTAPE